MKKFDILKVLFYMALSIFLFSLSFIVKGWAMSNITANFQNSIIELDYMVNTGAAFSSFSNSSWLLATAAFVIIFIIVCYVCYNTYRISYFKTFCLSMLTGGIAANLYERVMYGHVIDYIKIKHLQFEVFNLRELVFNFQDVLIVASCILLILIFQFSKETPEVETGNAENTTESPCSESSVNQEVLPENQENHE